MHNAAMIERDHGAATIAPRVQLAEIGLGAFVVAVGYNRSGTRLFIATGDGTIRISAAGSATLETPVHLDLGDALPLGLAPDCDPAHVLVGADDGCLRRIGPSGTSEVTAELLGGWIENVASHEAAWLRAFSSGRAVHVTDSRGSSVARFDDHPNTPAALCFSPDGTKIAVARYNGVTVWDIASSAVWAELFWRGSHTAVAWSPNGEFIVTATQDRDLHCWRLSDGRDFRMSGYPSKIRSISWTRDSAYLCASGADTVTSWFCGKGDPSGKPPLEFGYVFNGTVTQVAAHPVEDCAAAGFDDGTVLIGDIAKGDAIIAKGPGGGPVSSLDWAPEGRSLAIGTEGGVCAQATLRDGLGFG